MFQFIASIISLPARILGMRIGKHSVLGPGYPIVNKHYRGITLENNTVLGRNSFIHVFGKGKIHIRSGTNIGKDCTITSTTEITIGKKCLIGYRVSIIDHEHSIDNKKLGPTESGLTKGKKIEIGDECFIGAQSFIFKGVKLGKRCVVGANSVVTKSFSAGSVIAGNPAKKIC